MRGAVLERTLGSGPQHLRLNGAADPSGEGAGEDKVQTGKLRMGQVAKLGPAGTEAPGRDWDTGEARLGFLEGEQRISIPACRL